MKVETQGKRFKIGSFTPRSSYAKVLIPLLDGLGWMGSNRDLLEALCENPDDMDRDDLLKTMANLRFEGRRLKRISSLSYDRLPCLCINRKEQVYCLIKVDKENLLLYDPQKSQYCTVSALKGLREFLYFRTLDRERLNLLKPQKRWFSKVLLRFQKELTVLGILSLLLTLLSFLTPLLIILIYSQIEHADSRQVIVQLGGAVLLFILGTSGMKYLRSRLQNHFSGRLGNLVNQEINRRLLYLPPRYTEMTSLESQFSRIRDFESIKAFFSGRAFTSLIDAPLALIMLAGLSILAGPLAWIPFCMILIFTIGGFLSFRIYRRMNEERSQISSRKNLLRGEFLQMVGDAGSRWGASRWMDRIRTLSKEVQETAQQSERVLNYVDNIGLLLVKVSLVITISWGVIRVQNGLMDRGTLFASFLIISRILSPLYSGLTVFSQISKFSGSLSQLNRFMTLPLEYRPETLITLNKHIEGKLQFRNVYLKYGNEFAPVLRNISFRLREKQLLVLAGHGGSGKSSLLKLVLNQYAPYSGAILLDGMNIHQMDPIRLRKSIGYIPSDSTLFSGTLKKNLYMAKPDATEEELKDALRKWDLWDEIASLKDGLDISMEVFCPENQKRERAKKIHFAMQSLRQSPVILIDDLEKDLALEKISWIADKLEQQKRDSTLIVTSNNSILLEKADWILWMDNGQVYREGTPNDILPEFIETGYRQEEPS